MSTSASASEEALATMTCARLADVDAPDLLIGGYGMGYTLRAALAALGPAASVTVAELVPDIIAWAKGPMHALTARGLCDPRVQLVQDDVAMLIDAARNGYDAILLDVDNGPEGLTRCVNDHLYTAEGLQAVWLALKPGGILAVWSAFPDPTFTRRLVDKGFEVTEAPVRELSGERGAHHIIWFAQKLHEGSCVTDAAPEDPDAIWRTMPQRHKCHS